MNTRTLLMGSLSALVLGGTMVGCTAHGGGLASASTRSADRDAKAAADNAARASKALAGRQAADAVRFAEAAVELMPQEPRYRALLGQSYLTAGRFASARSALSDAMTLAPADPKVALNLVLAQIGTGDWAAARATLESHADIIPAGDRGLALALAGDPAGGVALLSAAARADTTNATMRQNLGLGLALAGQWQAARAVAAADLSPADVDARMEQWATFAQPEKASDQVASLLGVRAVSDAGQPVALALNAPVASGQVAVATAAVAPVVEAPAPVAVAAAQPGVPSVSNIHFAPRAEIVQALPAKLLVAATGPSKVALKGGKPVAATSTPAHGEWVVQIGAFDSVGVAKDAWGRAIRRMPALASRGPSGMNFATKTGQFYRLSVGGFSRGEADGLCRRYRATGGTCFVRAGAGDQVAGWTRPKGVQVASR